MKSTHPDIDKLQDVLLATKLYAPPPRDSVVRRPRLIEKMNAGLDGKLILVSAPAGFGKTTMVSEWITSCQCPVAWLALDEGDNDQTRFLRYVVAALQTIVPDIGKAVMNALQFSGTEQTELILTALLNDIASMQEDFVLILDDYHIIDSKPIDQTLTFILDHLPTQMHLVILTREDPNLPLARLRSRGDYIEIRAVSLRFTPDETTEFLNQVMNLNLSKKDILSLESRTEGWIAGLQLAALSMQGQRDVHNFIDAFSGSNRYIVDYLIHEVLQHQVDDIRDFLIQTSILDKFTASLCDAVCQRQDSETILRSLELGNLFLIPLDDKRQWYRYHHLFNDALRTLVIKEQTVRIATLNKRASLWFEDNGSLSEAISHSLAGEDFERAADLIELVWPSMYENYQSIPWIAWVKALPETLIPVRPVLSVGYAEALLSVGELGAAESRLQDAENWVASIAQKENQPDFLTTQPIVLDREQFQSLQTMISNARAFLSMALGDVHGTILHAQRVLASSPNGDPITRLKATVLLGIAQWETGDLALAESTVGDLMVYLKRVGKIAEAIGMTFILAEIKIALGHLNDALKTYELSLQMENELDEPMPNGMEDLYLGMSGLFRERGNLGIAMDYIVKAKHENEQAGLPGGWHHRLCVAEATVKKSQGDLNAALKLLQEAERVYVRTPLPELRPISARIARVQILQCELSDVNNWVKKQNLSSLAKLSYVHEYEHITLARLLIAGKNYDQIHEAIGLLERLLDAAEEGKRISSLIEILVQLALAHEAMGDTQTALSMLERGLKLAEPEGYFSLFTDEGQPLKHLLKEAVIQNIMPKYLNKLLATFDPNNRNNRDRTSQLFSSDQSPIEPLSKREKEVLQLVAQGLSNGEIAKQLFIAVGTIKGHNLKIFAKLEVKNRTEAVIKARDLGLVEP